jgi:hypothetical protein
VLARLLPNRHLLLPSRLDLRGNAQHITCLLKWSDLLPAQVVRPVALLIWTKLGTKVRGVKSLHYLDLEVGLNAQRQDGTVPKGM